MKTDIRWTWFAACGKRFGTKTDELLSRGAANCLYRLFGGDEPLGEMRRHRPVFGKSGAGLIGERLRLHAPALRGKRQCQVRACSGKVGRIRILARKQQLDGALKMACGGLVFAAFEPQIAGEAFPLRRRWAGIGDFIGLDTIHEATQGGYFPPRVVELAVSEIRPCQRQAG